MGGIVVTGAGRASSSFDEPWVPLGHLPASTSSYLQEPSVLLVGCKHRERTGS